MCVSGPQFLTAASLKVRLALFNERQQLVNKEITPENEGERKREGGKEEDVSRQRGNQRSYRTTH